MMNKTFASIFAIICVISILEVTTFNAKEHDENVHDDSFREFDEDSAFEYSSKTNPINDDVFSEHNINAGEDIEIRQPTGSNPSLTFQTPLNMPSIRFSFCVSCGYRQAFDQLTQVLRDKYPGIEVEGANYSPTQFKAIVAQFIGFAKITLIVMIVIGRDPFVSMGMATPQLFLWMINNKLSSCLMLFMLSNSVENMLMSTGAFEIHIGEEQIWSKLESGRPPSPGELVQAVDSYLAIKGDKIVPGSSFGFDIEN